MARYYLVLVIFTLDDEGISGFMAKTEEGATLLLREFYEELGEGNDWPEPNTQSLQHLVDQFSKQAMVPVIIKRIDFHDNDL